jgi:hypothetical protein
MSQMTQGTGNSSSNGTQAERVVDFNEIREQRLEEKRRNTERIFFKNLLSVYSVTGHSKMQPIELIDVSEDGCSFQIPHDPDNAWPNKTTEIPIRLYFSQDTYLEVLARIQNSRPSIENNARFVRYGCTVDKSTKSYPAYQTFVRFLKLYAEHAHKDMGDVTVFYL